MADAVFSIAASASAAAMAESRAEVSAVPYERVLSLDECKRLERAAHVLEHLDPVVHVWVRDARSFRHGKESTIPAFSLRLHPSLLVAEIRSMIQEKFAELSEYRAEREGSLTLLYESRVLESHKPFAEYLLPRTATASSLGQSTALLHGARSAKQTWPKPFVGIIWVIPFRPMRSTAIDWFVPPPATDSLTSTT